MNSREIEHRSTPDNIARRGTVAKTSSTLAAIHNGMTARQRAFERHGTSHLGAGCQRSESARHRTTR
jgi:hypothetical protein